MMMPHKVGTGCDGNIMPLNVLKELSPNTTDQMVATEDTTTPRKYNSTTITINLRRSGIVIKNNNKHKNASFLQFKEMEMCY